MVAGRWHPALKIGMRQIGAATCATDYYEHYRVAIVVEDVICIKFF